jgi:hypothetical protein
MADDLLKFLRDRLGEDERVAQAAAAELGSAWYYDDEFVLARREDDMVATGSQDFLDREHGEHIARHDPARVLREIDAKRQVLDWYEQRAAVDSRGEDPDDYENVTGSTLETVVQILALPYADGPGYREEWRP